MKRITLRDFLANDTIGRGLSESRSGDSLRDSLCHIGMQLRREQAVIEAMHRRPWWRVGILLRRPWRASWRPETLRDVWPWLTVAHDCQDPVIGCSCSGGFRFPRHDDPEIYGKAEPDAAHNA